MRKKHSSQAAALIFVLVVALTSSAFATTTVYTYDELNRLLKIHTPNGSVSVTITPSGAASSGAQWQVDSGPWFNSGDVATSIPVGEHWISFKNGVGWIAPAGQGVTVADQVTSPATATYTQQTFIVTSSAGSNGGISPLGDQTVDYGATITYTVSPGTDYHVSSVTGSGCAVTQVDTYTYTAGPITGNCSVSAAFAIDTGSLTVTISPAGAASGAQWQLDGSGAWYASGAQAQNVSVGSHTVNFNTVECWNGPGTQTYTVLDGQPTSQTAYYTQQTYTVLTQAGTGGTIELLAAGSLRRQRFRNRDAGHGVRHRLGQRLRGHAAGRHHQLGAGPIPNRLRHERLHRHGIVYKLPCDEGAECGKYLLLLQRSPGGLR